MRHPTSTSRLAALAALIASGATPAAAQRGVADTAAARGPWSVGAAAVGLVTHAAPAYDGRSATEGYLTQPVVMAHARLPRLGLAATATLNLEGVTLERGELDAGIWGEGYVDRRHPHTLVHEAVVGVGGRLDGRGRAAWSLSGGRGFVPFGSDDPMSRPLVKFPVNHHLSHVLERYVAVAGVRGAPGLLEVALFNGDEPTGPYASPAARRFGDSWAARATLTPAPGLELSASVAAVASPEHRGGQGLDQHKLHAGARLARGDGATPRLYLLVEASRTDDRAGGRRIFRYESLLAEGAARRGPWMVAARLERTTRPEEERLVDPFRSARPHAEGSIIGLTRWDVATLGATRELAVARRLRVAPLVEASWSQATARVRPAVFEPRRFYGASGLWGLSVGVRLGAGAGHARMGRYGVAALGGPASHDAMHHAAPAATPTSPGAPPDSP
jgi:hypothetical protein